MLTRRTYDFDDFNVFVLSLLFNVWEIDMFAQARFSSSGKGLHVRTIVNLGGFQDQNRELWSNLYGFDITFRTKKGKKVSNWLNIGIFLSRYDTLIINWCLKRCTKYGKKEKKHEVFNRRKR